MSKYTIGEFSRLTGYSTQTLRNWDESGKLVAQRTGDLGHRRYSQEQLDKILNVDVTTYENKKSVMGYFKIPNDSNPEEISINYDKLRKYLTGTLNSEFKIIYDDYSRNNRTEELASFNDLMLKVTKHDISDIVFLCYTKEDYFEYKSVASLLKKMDVQIHIIKNNVLTKGVEQKDSLVDMIIELSEIINYSEEDISDIIGILESNLTIPIEMEIKEID